jgi:hypothetical protein
MIALWLAKLAIPAWAVKLAAVLALCVAGAAYHHHVFHAGELRERAVGAAREAKQSQIATAAVVILNTRVAVAQADLALARARVAFLEPELQNEKAVSDDRQRRLVAGAERMQILTRQRPAGPPGTGQGAAAVGVDSEPAVVADIDGTVAANLEWLRSTRDSAVKRLNACVVEYDALKEAVDHAGAP